MQTRGWLLDGRWTPLLLHNGYIAVGLHTHLQTSNSMGRCYEQHFWTMLQRMAVATWVSKSMGGRGGTEDGGVRGTLSMDELQSSSCGALVWAGQLDGSSGMGQPMVGQPMGQGINSTGAAPQNTSSHRNHLGRMLRRLALDWCSR